MLYIAIHLPPTDFWINSKVQQGVPDMQKAYTAIFGQGMNIIIASLIAFVTGQLLDAYIFKKMKSLYKGKKIWLRATVSTLVSQLIDSIIVTYLAFWVAQKFPFALVSSWAINSYIYKFLAALFFSPLLYLFHFLIRKYLGRETSEELMKKTL